MLFNDSIATYCEQHSSKYYDVFEEIFEYSTINKMQTHMLSGRLQGRFLHQIVKLMQPTNVIEVGTFLGYATLQIATALPTFGKIVTLEKDIKTAEIARVFFNKSGCDNKIDLQVGEAATLLENMNTIWDFAFIDADKKNNELYYELILKQMRVGGLILIDNVLWKGKILDDVKDSRTIAIDNFNKKLATDLRVYATLLPLRDGIYLIEKL